MTTPPSETAASSHASSATTRRNQRLFLHVQSLLLVVSLLVCPPAVAAEGATKAFIKQQQTSSSSSSSSSATAKQQSKSQPKQQQQHYNKQYQQYDDIGANLEDHPDPNEEHYDDMIYVGRTMQDGVTVTRLGFHQDNSIKYIFGTSFDTTHSTTIPEHDLHPDDHPDHAIWTLDHDHQDHHDHQNDLPDKGHETKTREEALKERRHKGISQEGPKPFGHFETHAQDGGANPPHVVQVEPFFLDTNLVTNQDFGKFVRATYYETEAEQFGWSFVLQSFLPKDYVAPRAVTDIHVDPEAPDWVAVEGAYWRRPEGPTSSYKLREHHPVVHVSHRDAAEYCQWRKKRLPGEREWEAAARAGYWGPNNRTKYSWSIPQSKEDHDSTVAQDHANLWGQGAFPHENHAEDGWRGTSPVQTYPPNKMGFYDMTGNVWEWMRGGKSVRRSVCLCFMV